MWICKVTGSVVSTIKDERLVSKKLLVVVPTDPKGNPISDPIVAVDTVGAGDGEVVLVTTGSAARQSLATGGLPTDATIVGIIDSISEDGATIFKKA